MGTVDAGELSHLLRRTEFVVRPARYDALIGLSRAQAVDDILDIGRNGVVTLPAQFLAEPADGQEWNQYAAATTWWLDRMVNAPRPMQEKMTLFWHGHFVSSWRDINKGWHMMRQNALYRALALGDLLELTQKMAVEPAMLVYLSNAENVKGEPNQNFARELMELFTLGVGNYTEADVDASARAWTGHNAPRPAQEYVFRPGKHDTGLKTFFGTTKNWDGPDVINEILRDNPAKRVVAARFVTKKLWEFFAHPGPPAGVVESLADTFLAAGRNLTVLMRAMLNRDEFYAPAARQGLVRTPIEMFVAISAASGLNGDALGLAWASGAAGQQMFAPPNVSGWRPNGYWLTTSGVNGRAEIARNATWKLRNGGRFDDLYSMSAAAAVDTVARFFGVYPLSNTSRSALITAHQAERAASTWDNWWGPTNLLTMTMLTPEFHMA